MLIGAQKNRHDSVKPRRNKLLFQFTGIAGTGHHYYWLSAPKYWLWVGGVFSALEPFPILLMVADTYREVRRRAGSMTPGLTRTYLIGMVILHFLGLKPALAAVPVTS
jgi:nitric oxide reductase subunit B